MYSICRGNYHGRSEPDPVMDAGNDDPARVSALDEPFHDLFSSRSRRRSAAMLPPILPCLGTAAASRMLRWRVADGMRLG